MTLLMCAAIELSPPWSKPWAATERPVLLFLIIGFSTNAIFAQDEALMKGTETPKFKTKTDTTNCFVFNQYVVKTASGEGVGENISVYKRASSTNANAGCKVKNA